MRNRWTSPSPFPNWGIGQALTRSSFQTHDDANAKQVNQVVVNRQVQEEMEKRYAHLVSRLTSLKTESEETWKTIETAEKTLMEMINQRDYDCAHYFIDEPRADNKQPESMLIKMKADRQETEDFYLGVKKMIYTFLVCLIFISIESLKYQYVGIK